MSFLIYIIAGILGGMIGGMGMGGGTILIPILAVLLKVNQHTAQAVNLISFIPMSVAAICVHKKNGYIRFKDALPIILPALLFCVLGSYLARVFQAEKLRVLFGAFLIALAVFQLVKTFKAKDLQKD